METKISLVLSFVFFALIMGCTPNEKYKVNETYNGFKLVEKKFVQEINAECLYFSHEKSGAHLLKIAADDANKLFNTAFKTAPETDYGTPHIMEHSVLNGSKNFPVKSPFDVLSKGSLNTFLNAMTGADITTYPVASMNNKDYFNLMHVYLDAVFNPLIYDDPRIFKQEGWHRELTDKDGEIVYKGVVYNEMKGAYSSPTRELNYQVKKHLFPDNTYGVSSGGYPDVIPKLTYEDFINFHKKYYHPSNSYILLYGNADLDRELQFIDSAYLSKYEKSDKKVEIPIQAPFNEMKVVEKTYAVPDGSSTEDKTYLSFSFVVGKNTDRSLCMAFDVLSEALVNHESAPLRLAIQEAGIGRDIRASFNESQQNVFEIIVQNANSEDKDKFKEIVLETFQKVADDGLDKSMVEGILNRMEFNLKEGNTPQKGLRYLMMSYSGWFFNNDPFLGLEFNKPLEKVKTALETDLLESTIKEYLISNPHALLMVLTPQPGLQKEINKISVEELAAYKATLNDEGLEKLINETEELLAHQKREDSPEALATIPLLDIADISKEVEWYAVEEKSIANIPVVHYNDFTNNILYTNFYFDISALPQDLVPYASLLSSVLGKLNTENYTFGELDNALNIHTGGFYTRTNTFLENKSDDNLLPKFVITSKATTDKADKLFELAGEIINKSDFNDIERLKTVLVRHQARVDANIKQNGIRYAMTRLSSYYSNDGMFDELTGGLDYYRFITDLVNKFDENSEEIIKNLTKTASLLFTQNNLISSVTCSTEDMEAYAAGFEKLAGSLPEGQDEITEWKFDFTNKNEGLLTASKVQYVIKGYNFKKLGYEWDGKMRVLNQILSTDWLQNQIRVIGGAYGGFCGFSPSGDVFFASYRDPNLKETLDNYDATPGFLQNFEADEKEMTRFLIGTISGMDRPMTASQKGDVAIQRYFEKTTIEDIKNDRSAVLSTTMQDIKDFEKVVQDILKQDAYCVYGNEQKIKENKDLFHEMVNISK